MKNCPRCGFHHIDADTRCIRCGTLLDAVRREEDLDPLAAEPPEFYFKRGPQPRRWETPGRLAGWLRRRLFIFAERLRSPLPESVHERNPWLAGLLATVPGLGQLYNHQPKKAALMLGAAALMLALAALTLHCACSNGILLALLLGWIYSFHDAFITAKRINREPTPWQHLVAFYCAWIFYFCSLCMTVQYLGGQWGILLFRHISASVVAPWLRKGERVTILELPYHFRAPRVGEVVYYRPQALATQDLSFIVHPKNMIERIVAAPGDTYERREGRFFRNGRPATPLEQPLMPGELPTSFTIKAPPDRYVILFSYTGSSLEPAMGGFSQAPPLSKAYWKDWDQSCLVNRDAIFGRVWFVYNPPAGRRFVN